MEFNEVKLFIKRAFSARVGKIRKDCQARVGWGDKGRHSDFIQITRIMQQQQCWLGQLPTNQAILRIDILILFGSTLVWPDLYLAVWWR